MASGFEEQPSSYYLLLGLIEDFTAVEVAVR